MSSRGTRGRGNDATANLLFLEYNGRQTVTPRPQGYQVRTTFDNLRLDAWALRRSGLQNLRQSLRRYLPDIPDDHDDFALETNELALSARKWVIISQDAFELSCLSSR
jgi:hypothetical protein